MTKSEAVEILKIEQKSIHMKSRPIISEALDMAIEALERETEKYETGIEDGKIVNPIKYEGNVPDICVVDIEQEFKVGDWVKSKTSGYVYQITEIIKERYFRCNESGSGVFFLDEFEHAEPPKEEKQKIEFIFDTEDCSLGLTDVLDKINELVDAVNELRGV